MGDNIRVLELEPGFITIGRAAGPPVRYPLTDLITTGDMPPDMTPTQTIDMMPVLTSLAQVVVILWKTLMEAGILGEEYADNWDIQYIEQVLINEFEAEWGE